MSIPFSKLSQEIDTTLPARRERKRRANLRCPDCGHLWALHWQEGPPGCLGDNYRRCYCKRQKSRRASKEPPGIAQGSTVTPEALRKATGRRETGRDGVMRAVLDLLKDRGILHFRRNVGAMRNASGRHVAFGHPGEADIEAHFSPSDLGWINKPGVVRAIPDRQGLKIAFVDRYKLQRIVWIEVKSPIGKQSAKQEAFQRIVEAAGETYLVIRSAEQLERWIQENI